MWNCWGKVVLKTSEGGRGGGGGREGRRIGEELCEVEIGNLEDYDSSGHGGLLNTFQKDDLSHLAQSIILCHRCSFICMYSLV